MNTELLLKVKKQILREPRQFNMDYWFAYSIDIPNCNTAACIAGWSITLGLSLANPFKAAKEVEPRFSTKDWSALWGESADKINEIAIPLLQLTKEQSERLFSVSEWPQKFRLEDSLATTPQEHAEIAARRIDHFIATKGEE